MVNLIERKAQVQVKVKVLKLKKMKADQKANRQNNLL